MTWRKKPAGAWKPKGPKESEESKIMRAAMAVGDWDLAGQIKDRMVARAKSEAKKIKKNPCGPKLRKRNPSSFSGVQRQLGRYHKLGITTTLKEYPIANGKVGFWEIRMEHPKHGFVRAQMPLKYATGSHDAALSRTLSALSRKLLGRRAVRSNPATKNKATASALKLAIAIQELEAQVGRLYSLDPRAERKLQQKIDALKVKLRGRRK